MSARSKDGTPAMRQYQRFKRQHPDCVLFFRMGDFYEMFYEDAELAHRVLGVALTKRQGLPMAGVPYHAVETYLRRMIEAGYRAAVCDQVEDAALAKGVVKRDVTRVVTPGTITDESLLEEGRENPLAAVVTHGATHVAAAWAELSTGAFAAGLFTTDELTDELARVAPRELLHVHDDRPDEQRAPDDAGKAAARAFDALAERIGAVATGRPPWQFRQNEAVEVTKRQFQVATLAGFGFSDDDPLIAPIGGIIHYLLETQKSSDGSRRQRINHLRAPIRFSRDAHLTIDQVSLRSLEIDRSLQGGKEATLLSVLQECVTAMGKRTLRQWLCYPLRRREAIETRHRVVSALVEDAAFLDRSRGALRDVQDVPRTAARLSVGRASPRDLVGLGRSARQAEVIRSILEGRPATRCYYDMLDGVCAPLSQLADRIAAACVDSPPGHLREGGLIRDGYDATLDEYRGLRNDSHAWLAKYQKELIDQTGITSLKVAFNKVFGYYIEVTAANRDRAPDTWSRKQTLKNAERFITPDLKAFEGKVLSAEQRAVSRELELFEQLTQEATEQLHRLHVFAEAAAALDVLCCFARRAVRRRYVRPQIADDPVLHIDGGRHPVLDEMLADQFVPNDVDLGGDGAASGAALDPTLALITGPNMAGKSTYIRQTALIVLMAQAGSFVPAEAATVGLCDRIFTRVGASDELHAGRSTFMVEMTETAHICHHATAASLVILDEIGRGTSTLDGLSLAWALAEHLAERRCRTLFATHYHELTTLAETCRSIVNLNVTVREWHDEIVFLHRIVPGSTDRSYGIHVAKIAGVPTAVIARANELLAQLEVSHRARETIPISSSSSSSGGAGPGPDGQMSLFTEYLHHPALEALSKVNLEQLSPIQAFEALRKLREMIDTAGRRE